MANQPNTQKGTAMDREGLHYEETKNQPITEIARLIRTEIRKAAENGTIPADWKYSVRLRRFAGGQAIDIEIGIPDEFLELRFIDQEATRDFVREIHESFHDHAVCVIWRKAGV